MLEGILGQMVRELKAIIDQRLTILGMIIGRLEVTLTHIQEKEVLVLETLNINIEITIIVDDRCESKL